MLAENHRFDKGFPSKDLDLRRKNHHRNGLFDRQRKINITEGNLFTMAKVFWDQEDTKRIIKYWERSRRHKKLLEFVANLIPPGSILDIPCGCGDLYPFVRNREYIGVDNSPWMLEWAKKKYPGINVRYGDVYNLEGLGKYDNVVCISLFLHLPNIERPLVELWKHTKRCLIFTIHRGKPRRRIVGGFYIIIRSEEEIEKYIQKIDPSEYRAVPFDKIEWVYILCR